MRPAESDNPRAVAHYRSPEVRTVRQPRGVTVSLSGYLLRKVALAWKIVRSVFLILLGIYIEKMMILVKVPNLLDALSPVRHFLGWF